MSALESILGRLPDRVSSGRQDHIFTPSNIAKEMVNALPDDVWNRHTTFLDPICKSGIFLYEIYQRLMETNDLIEAYPDPTDRREYIINNQLFGIAVDPMCQMVSIRSVYGYLEPNSHIILLSDYQTIMKNADKRFLLETLQKEFGMKKFGVVIGNPPYNNDAYLDFVQLGHKLSDKCSCWITPAKWQAKGGKKNEDFRREIVPYMEKIVFCPNSNDIFCINERGGISYYVVSNKTTECKQIKVEDKMHELISSDFEGKSFKKRILLHNSVIENIIDKLGNYTPYKPEISIHYTYNVFTSLMICSAQKDSLYPKEGVLLILNPMTIVKDMTFYISGNYKCIFSAKTTDECNSFISYTNTKLARFLIYCSLCGNSITTNESWRFVPSPEAFDHIFTDAELYEKYNLTQEEIDIIESVIKERK